MGDLLLRGIDDALRQALHANARRNGRSLSEEAIASIRSALHLETGDKQPAGKRLRKIVGEERFSDAELDAIAAFRKEADRAPPSFE